MTGFNWQFDRGQFDVEHNVTPIRMTFATIDGPVNTTMQVVVTEEAALEMLAALNEAVRSGLTVATAMPESNGRST